MVKKWNNMLDYMQWRGDLGFDQSPFNVVDALALTQFAYIPFDGLVPGLDRMDRISIGKLAEDYFERRRNNGEEQQKSPLGVLVPAQIIDLFQMAMYTKRFRNVRASFYINDVEQEEEKQFCAITFFVNEDLVFVAYRGTDDTIVGWKEDFNMALMQAIPAQLESDRYLRGVARNLSAQGFEGKICLGGHSKGGNLAVYAAMCAPEEVKEQIESIYNFDGPGFGRKIIEGPLYQEVCDKIHSLVPQSSVVGMLLEHEENYIVVKSSETGIMQHDALSWQVLCTEFVTVNKVSSSSEIIDRTLKKWLSKMPPEEIENFITALFEILASSEAVTITQLASGKTRSISAMIRAYQKCDEPTRKLLRKTVRSLVDISRNTFVETQFLTNTANNNKI